MAGDQRTKGQDNRMWRIDGIQPRGSKSDSDVKPITSIRNSVNPVIPSNPLCVLRAVDLDVSVVF